MRTLILIISGYFRISSSLQCAKCSPCYKDYPGFQYHVEPECQRRMPRGSENICTPALDIPIRPRTTTKAPSLVIDFSNENHSNKTELPPPDVRLVIPKDQAKYVKGNLLHVPEMFMNRILKQKKSIKN